MCVCVIIGLEEMNILKEILFKREREKHFLEKELETYKHIDDDQETEDDNFNKKREGDEDKELIMHDVHVIEDNYSNAKVRDDDVTTQRDEANGRYSEATSRDCQGS